MHRLLGVASRAVGLLGPIAGFLQEGVLKVHEGQPGVGARETRVERDGATKEIPGGLSVRRVEAMHVLQTEVEGEPGVDLLSTAPTRVRRFVERYPQIKSCRYACSHCFANCEHIVGRAGESVDPNHFPRTTVRQFNSDDKPPLDALDNPGQDVADGQPTGGLQGIQAADAEGGTAGSNPQPSQAAERRDQIMGQRVRKARMMRPRAEVPEGQNRDARPSYSRFQARSLLAAGVTCDRTLDSFGRRHEAKAPPVHGPDEPLRARIVPEEFT